MTPEHCRGTLLQVNDQRSSARRRYDATCLHGSGRRWGSDQGQEQDDDPSACPIEEVGHSEGRSDRALIHGSCYAVFWGCGVFEILLSSICISSFIELLNFRKSNPILSSSQIPFSTKIQRCSAGVSYSPS